MKQEHLEAALPAGADPRQHARALARAHQAAVGGDRPPSEVRDVIRASWNRMLDKGLDPDRGSFALLDPEEVEGRRRYSGLTDALPILREGLTSVAEEAAHIMVIVDADGYVLWRDGSSQVRRRADGLGFIEGASWMEDVVGTNAIGTALVTQRPLQVYSAEHYVRTHHAWTCSCAPLHDPRDGRLMGAVDVSGPALTVNPTTLALVASVTKLAESQLRTEHLRELERLRAISGGVLAKQSGAALITDKHGWIAAATSVAPVDRVLLPRDCVAGHAWLPAFGQCALEPLPGGWLVRMLDGEDSGTTSVVRVVLDVSAPRTWSLSVQGAGGSWQHTLSPRHAELLYILACHREGRSAAELAGDLFGDPARTVTVRAEMSRLRRHFGGILAHRPYRFHDGVEVSVLHPEPPHAVLPHSVAPGVRATASR
ncbi:GAF domain-containing protein [Haloechinothrix alba]|uniref:GAF domain-containing protein n=1 Tax=Haloechinothrix alba TaxID=664784 RepID=A0A238Y0V3_9PSEU|nr:helix-turn-helix domain-containing protein [Haloechinothrix alba]SNR64855.1 GAF domain-containing protein [Haloechinothrix alba]